VPTRLEPRAHPPLERATPPAAVDLNGVVKTYAATRREAPVRALDGLDLWAVRDEVLAVVGPSGCGKTTLLELICGLQRPDDGRMRCDPAALMPQRDLLLPWLSALDNAAVARRLAGRSRVQARADTAPRFAQLGLAGFEEARPYELSGGMRQRVAFLRTLMSGKPVLCLDEPFGALDAITRVQMQAWLDRALADDPRTVVLVTHDVEEAVLLADRVVVLSPRPGRVVSEFAVDLRRPRARTDAGVVALRERALEALGLGLGSPPQAVP
jgi:NitT/TauT family transport system ATP-binding protein